MIELLSFGHGNAKLDKEIYTFSLPSGWTCPFAEQCLAKVNLVNCNSKYPSEISGGMKKRVGIARAIALPIKYLFCDEPNSGLDPLTAVKIDLLIQEITVEYGITTIVISHDMNSVMRMGQYIMFLKDGKKMWEGNSTNMMSNTVPELQEFLSTKLI
jgi:phospholipid/cholesterol/gamma-HCH transport system ATP-binding protein